MNKLRAMEIFIAVVESGNFSEAAKRLDISAVMVGKAVAQTEDFLQTRLLQRNTRRQTLTEAGKAWYEESQQVMAALRDAENRIDSLRPSTAALTVVAFTPVRIGCWVKIPVVSVKDPPGFR